MLVQPASLLIAYLIGALMRRVLPQRVHLSTSSATLTALIGLWAGMATGSWLFREEHVWAPRIIAAAALVAAVVVVITAVVLSRIQHEPALAPIASVAARGESDRLEFKSSARVNMHTGKRDEAMETVVAKTVAAFLNARGGTLLLGVDDSGALIGLDPDYETLRQPDADRFELFLRDLWRTRLGTNAAALPRLDFAPASDGEGEVCRVSVPPSPRPVYLAGAKGKDGRELWVRAGNSTQRLEVDDAVTNVPSAGRARYARPCVHASAPTCSTTARRLQATPEHRPPPPSARDLMSRLAVPEIAAPRLRPRGPRDAAPPGS